MPSEPPPLPIIVLEHARAEHPLVQFAPALAERVFKTLLRPRAKTIERDRKTCNAHFRHNNLNPRLFGGIVEYTFERFAEHSGDLKCDLQRRRIFSLFDCVDRLASNPDFLSQLLLRHLSMLEA